MARGLKFRIYEAEGLYYLCSKNKGADQLCGYHIGDTANLQLCFCISKSMFSHDAAHFITIYDLHMDIHVFQKTVQMILQQFFKDEKTKGKVKIGPDLGFIERDFFLFILPDFS